MFEVKWNGMGNETRNRTNGDLVDDNEEKGLSPRVQWFCAPQYYPEKLEHPGFLWNRHLEAEECSRLESVSR